MRSCQTKVDKIRINTVMYNHEQINAKGKQRETEQRKGCHVHLVPTDENSGWR